MEETISRVAIMIIHFAILVVVMFCFKKAIAKFFEKVINGDWKKEILYGGIVFIWASATLLA